MSRRARSVLALAAVALLSLALAAAAQARSYSLVESNVTAVVAQDGSVSVVERITVSFDGSYTFGFREVPYRSGESIDGISVSENGVAYRPGAPTELEPGGPVGTFGVRDLGGRIRVVWRFQSASGGTRTFTVRYRMRGLAVAYDDVVDVNLKVWGDEWEQSLGRLSAEMRGPGNVVRAWGHPVWVKGDVTLQGNRALLRAVDISANQFVELRALFPRRSFTSDRGNEGRGRSRPAEDHRRGAGRRSRICPRPPADRRCDRAPVAHRPDPARARDDPRLPGGSRRLLDVRPRARHGLRPRVRAGAADGDTARSRPHADAAGWRGRLVRVHGDALRSRAPGRLPRRADHDRALDLGWPAQGAGARPPALGRQPRGGAHALGEGGHAGRRRRARRRHRGALPASASASRPTASRCPSGSRRSRRTWAAR